MTAHDAFDMIWKYENEVQKLTQKHALDLVSDAWFLENYQQGMIIYRRKQIKMKKHHLHTKIGAHRISLSFKELRKI